MKFFLTLLLVWFSPSLLAQNWLLPTLNNKIEHTVAQGYEIGDFPQSYYINRNHELFYYSNNYFKLHSLIPAQADFFNQILNGEHFAIVVRDLDLNEHARLPSKNIKIEHITPHWVHNIEPFNSDSSELLISGIGIDSSTMLHWIWEAITDTSLHVLRTNKIPLDKVRHLYFGQRTTFSSLQKNSNRRVFIASGDSLGYAQLRRGYVLDSLGLPIDSNLYIGKGIRPINITYYLNPQIFGRYYALLPFHLLDSNLHQVCTWSFISMDHSSYVIPLSADSSFLTATTSIHLEPDLSATWVEGVFKVNTQCVIDTIYMRTEPGHPDEWISPLPGFHSLVMDDTSNIYFCNSRGGSFFDTYSELHEVQVRKINLSGDLKWWVAFGASGRKDFYTPSMVHVMPDGGLMVLILHVERTQFGFQSDLIAVRLDSDGNLLPLTSSIEEQRLPSGLELKRAFLYPNPVINELTIEVAPQVKDPRIELFDAMGKLVLSEALSVPKHRISLGSLPSGFYFYRILDKNGAVADMGKLVKN